MANSKRFTSLPIRITDNKERKHTMSGTIFFTSLLALLAGVIATCWIDANFSKRATLMSLLLTIAAFIFLASASFCFWDFKDLLCHLKYDNVVNLDYEMSKAPTEVIASLKECGYSVVRLEDYHPGGSQVNGIWRFEVYCKDPMKPCTVRDRYDSLSNDSK